MKQLIDLIRQDFHEEGFTTRDYIYSVLFTIGFIALCILAETLEPSY
jgi:hypothetical protein